jgi:hypothetical protein
MTTINSTTHTALSTVAENSQLQAQNAAAVAANSTDVDNTVNRIAETREALNSPREDGANTLKSINIEQAKMDVSLSETELIVYDGELSSSNIELQTVRAEISSKRSALTTEEAKSEIKTSINAEGNAEFVTHSGMKIVTDTNKGGDQTWIYNPAGEQLMHIHGDPHVNMLKDADGNNGDDFHFGDDSTLKFEDGTELTFNTTEMGKDTGIFYTTGIYVRAGDNVMQTGEQTAGGARRADIAKVDKNSYNRAGDTAKGSVTMGLKGDGQILMQTGDKWNEIKDESWDGYLKDKTFNDQKGAAVDFKPKTIHGADGLSALKLEITQLEKKETNYGSRVTSLRPLKSLAEANLDAANSNLANFLSMDDSEFVDNDESRKNVEQKSLDLSKRANNLGVFISKSSLVGAGDLTASGINQAHMIADGVAADREFRGNKFDYTDKGLEKSATRNDKTADLIDTLANLAEVGGFEEKSLKNDELPKTSFTQGMTNYNDTFSGLMKSVGSGTTSVTAAQNQLKILGKNLVDDTDTITLNYKDFMLSNGENNLSGKDAATNPVTRLAQMEIAQGLNANILIDLESQMPAALVINTDAGGQAANKLRGEITTVRNLSTLTNDSAAVMGQLVGKVKIDFGDMNKEQAKGLYDLNINSLKALEGQQAEALSLDTDSGRVSSASLNTELKLSRHLVKELERQFGFKKPEDRYDQSMVFVDLNKKILSDLQLQMNQALDINTDAGRVSAASLRNEIGTTKSMIGFWTETAQFWKP